ncbi:MAG: hypothetical protein AAGI66_05845 [Cyanobacteria bacterium P01_H01_bin.74]
MILEAFSIYLKAHWKMGVPSQVLLNRWLKIQLHQPIRGVDPVLKIIQTELAYMPVTDSQDDQDNLEKPQLSGIIAKSDSGHRLLKTLIRYCKSYDQWQFSRWLHNRKASDFVLKKK